MALTVVALLFSLNYIVSKVAMNAFTPLTFAFLRVSGSAVALNFLMPRDPRPFERSDRLAVLLFALLGVVLNQSLFLAGLSLTSAHIAAILMTTVPVFTLGIAMIAGRERGTPTKIGGISLAAGGALLVIGGQGFSGTTREMAGAVLLAANALSYASYLVLSKRAMSRLSPRRVIARMFADAALLMIPLCAYSLAREPWAKVPGSAWVGLAVVIAGPTVAAYSLNAWALAHTESSVVAVYTYMQPFITTILAASILHERIRGAVVVAAAMIFAGVYLSGRPAPPAATPEAVPGSPE
jgi:drug/metabolite transporter (DMT)-like permease